MSMVIVMNAEIIAAGITDWKGVSYTWDTLNFFDTAYHVFSPMAILMLYL